MTPVRIERGDMLGAYDRVLVALEQAERARVLEGDAVEHLMEIEPESVDVVWTDPPYFLSRPGGTTCRGGKSVSVNKGAWDKPRSFPEAVAFATVWMHAVKRILKPTGSLWVAGTTHVTHSIANAAIALRMPLINAVTWAKPNPPPHLACRTLTHSTETLQWFKREPKSPYHFDYVRSREIAGDRQLLDVWTMQAPRGEERKRGAGHPTQKPVEVVRRCLELTCPPDGLVVDPFAGSGTTGEAALVLGLRVVLIDADPESAARCRRRIQECH